LDAGRSAALLEREAELALIERGLEFARGGRGGLLVLEGPAGIGKTSLMAAADARAGGLGMCSLRARAGQLERDFAFGVVRQLFEPVVVGADAERRARLMSGAAALSAALFDFERAPEAVGADPSHGVLHGLFWLTANLAGGAPLLLAVDDLHWCDAPSLRFLGLSRPSPGGPAGVAAGGHAPVGAGCRLRAAR
jgi:predicted ATPase